MPNKDKIKLLDELKQKSDILYQTMKKDFNLTNFGAYNNNQFHIQKLETEINNEQTKRSYKSWVNQ